MGSDPVTAGPGLRLKDRYRIEKELGRGGIGVVYLARDEQLHSRPVVIKVLLDQTAGSDWFQKKFRGELEALVRIDHPGVVGALDAGEMPDGKPFLVMQYVQGVTLRSLMNKALLEPHEVAVIVRQVGGALQAAHESGVHHRDLKPENIMVQDLGHGEKQVKIIDFGIATVRDPSDAGTQMTQVAGSVLYMAPEQLMGRPQAASDTYALAVITYEMLTGRPPFRPHSPYELLSIQRAGVKERPSELRAGLSPALDEMVLKGLALEPSDRPATSREFADGVARALGTDVGTMRRPAPATEVMGVPTARDTGPVPTQVSPPTHAPVAGTSPDLEMAHVLFTDIVGYSMLPMDHQRDVLGTLQRVIQATSEYRRAHAAHQLVSLPTGDGMALVFFGDPTGPVRCAMEVGQALKSHPEIQLRMGIHTGPVYRVADINANLNVAGGGINIAQRVMDSGDAGHILLSRAVADVVSQLSQWSTSLRDLGEHAVKHGVRVQLFNLCTPEVGNPDIPSKLRAAATSGRKPAPAQRTVMERDTPARSKMPLIVGGAVAAVIAVVAAVLLLKPPPSPSPTASAAPGPGPATPARELTYYLTVQKYQGGQPYRDPFRLAREMLFGPEDRMRVTVTSPQTGFLYIFNEGPDPATGQTTFNVLHPRTSADGGSAALSGGKLIHIPSEGGYFRFDQAQGTETLWLVFADREVPELEAVKGLANPTDRGVVKDAAQVQGLRSFLAAHRDQKPEAVPDETEKKTLLRAKGSVLVNQVKLEHM